MENQRTFSLVPNQGTKHGGSCARDGTPLRQEGRGTFSEQSLNLGIRGGQQLNSWTILSRPKTDERERFSDDIKSAALEMMVPTEIERRLILNKNRLNTYPEMKAETEVLIESAVGAKGKIVRPGTASSSQEPDVDSLTQAINSIIKGSGQGQRKRQRKRERAISRQRWGHVSTAN